MARKASESYLAKLRDPRWQKRRLHIFERDNFTCRFCGATDKTLHVHHTHYERGKGPWETSSYGLVTLCENCHEAENFEARRHLEEELVHAVRAVVPVQHLHLLVTAFLFAGATPSNIRNLLNAIGTMLGEPDLQGEFLTVHSEFLERWAQEVGFYDAHPEAKGGER